MQNKKLAVCICTFRRPEMLEKLLQSLTELNPVNGYDVKVVVVDNDPRRSGQPVVEKAAESSDKPITYVCEEKPGISFARNTALRTAGENDCFIFIDDDEYASAQWLRDLVKTHSEYCADAVAGPVVPYFDEDCPEWARPLWDRGRMATGTILPVFRTGNLLLAGELVNHSPDLFDAKLGLSGGEDTMLSLNLAKAGKRIVWCDTALVYERQTADKCTLSYQLFRSYVGGLTFRYSFRKCYPGVVTLFKGIVKDLGWITFGIIVAMTSIVRGKTVFAKGLSQAAKGIGGIISLFRSNTIFTGGIAMNDNREIGFFENCYAGLMLILLCSGGSLTIFQRVAMPASSILENAEGNAAVQVIWTVLYITGIILAVRNARGVRQKIKGNIPLLCLTGFAFLSIIWSEFPALSERRCIALSLTTALGLYYAVRFTMEKFVRLLAVAMLLAALVSIFVAVFMPDYGQHADGRHVAWNGLFGHKNHLATAMFIGVVSWGITFFKETGRKRFLALLYLATCLIVMYMAKSATSSVILFAVMIFSILRYVAGLMPRGSIFWASLMVCFFVMLAYILIDPTQKDADKVMMKIAGRDSSLTGRTILWDILEDEISKKPLGGYGYSAYWLGERGPSRVTWEKLRLYGIMDEISHSHNGFIDIVVNLGYIGLFLSLAFLLQVFYRSLIISWRSRIMEDQLPILLTLVFVSYNFSERQVLMYHSILWMLICTIAFKVVERIREITYNSNDNPTQVTDQ